MIPLSTARREDEDGGDDGADGGPCNGSGGGAMAVWFSEGKRGRRKAVRRLVDVAMNENE